MILKLAEIFGENMVLQRNKEIPVWGSSVSDDLVIVTLGDEEQTCICSDGAWMASFAPREACRQIKLQVRSTKTGEQICLENLAIGEVWLCGGQSNMEFLLKYDVEMEELAKTEEDPDLRYFCNPQRNFEGVDRTMDFSRFGFWRSWDKDEENRKMFGAVPFYMGRILRRELEVPVGMIGCNWGGTPAAAWASMEKIKATPAMKPVLDWYEQVLAKLDWQAYYLASEEKAVKPDPEIVKMQEKGMMGIGLREWFEEMIKRPPMPLPVYSPYVPGPRACIRPAGLYETMLKRLAPYAIAGVIWYQGEDDDMREWSSFYDESLKAVAESWRELWGEELPFYMVELAPYEGMGAVAAKNYPLMREMIHKAAADLKGSKSICIMDLGDDINIHFRNKRLVGERLALLAERYVYGMDVQADSPELKEAERRGREIRIRFTGAEEGLYLEENSSMSVFEVFADGMKTEPSVYVDGQELVLSSDAFEGAGLVSVAYAKQNYCHGNLFSANGLPVFPFRTELR